MAWGFGVVAGWMGWFVDVVLVVMWI